jgi:hypothetical protein
MRDHHLHIVVEEMKEQMSLVNLSKWVYNKKEKMKMNQMRNVISFEMKSGLHVKTVVIGAI